MKITYLTLESYSTQPIIRSQVINLFRAIEEINYSIETDDSIEFQLVTFEPITIEEEGYQHQGVNYLTHIGVKNRGVLSNMLYLIINGKKYFSDTNLIHVRSYLPMIPALFMKLAYGKKVIFDMRGVMPEETRLRKKNNLLYWFLLFLEKLACRYANKTVVVSNAFSSLIAERTSVKDSNLIVIPTFSTNSVKLNHSKDITDIRKQNNWAAEAPIFVYSGAFEKWQCSEEILKFMLKTSNRLPEARFVVLSKQINEFKSFLNSKLSNRLYYIASIPNEQLTDMLSQCNYGLLFREKNIINKVAAPIKFKDYLSAGVPVIVTDGIGDYSQYIRESNLGFILNDLSDEEYNRVLEEIVEHKNEFSRDKIINAANNLFDVKKAGMAYLKLYKSLN